MEETQEKFRPYAPQAIRGGIAALVSFIAMNLVENRLKLGTKLGISFTVFLIYFIVGLLMKASRCYLPAVICPQPSPPNGKDEVTPTAEDDLDQDIFDII